MSVTQLGVDRVIDLVFGSGDHTHHLIVELYDRVSIMRHVIRVYGVILSFTVLCYRVI